MSFLQSFFEVGSIASYLGRYVDHFAILGAVGLGYIVLKATKRVLSLTFRSVRRSFPVDLKQQGRWAGE